MVGGEVAWANAVAEKANCIIQVDGELLAAGKGYKDIITLTSISRPSGQTKIQGKQCAEEIDWSWNILCLCVYVQT